MPFIDDRGRVFGRFNIVDAALVAVFLILVPAAYASYRLFNDPVPTLTSVQPPIVPSAPGWQVEVRGSYFRPYLRVTFNDTQGKTFQLVNPSTAVVVLPDLPPGVYDVALFDYTREVARIPSALTVEPPVTAQVELEGVLEFVSQREIDAAKVGAVLREGAVPVEFLAVEPVRPANLVVDVGSEQPATLPAANGALEIPVRVRTRCALQPNADGTARCAIGGVALKSGVTVHLPVTSMALNLRVRQVRGLTP